MSCSKSKSRAGRITTIAVICLAFIGSHANTRENSARLLDLMHSATPVLEGYAKTRSASHTEEYGTCRDEARLSYFEYTTDGREFVEWETAAIPASISSNEVAFMWTCGLGTHPGLGKPAPHKFFINGKESFSVLFQPQQDAAWTSGDYRLYFNYLAADKWGDTFGVMCLIVPARDLEPGKPLCLKMAGSAGSSKSWFALQAYTNTTSYFKERHIKLSENVVYRLKINKKVFEDDDMILLQMARVPSSAAGEKADRKLSFQAAIQQTGRTNTIRKTLTLAVADSQQDYAAPLCSTRELACGKFDIAVTVLDETNNILTVITEQIKNLAPLKKELKDTPPLM